MILGTTGQHKYLGRAFFGDLRQRGRAAVEHRVGCAWMKYKSLQHVFEDRHVSIALRLKLFDAVVGSTAVYALETCPLTTVLQRRLDVVQRTMMRRMVGWVCYAEDSWEERGRRMKHRLQRGLALHPVQPWSVAVDNAKRRLMAQKAQWPKWSQMVADWEPSTSATWNTVGPYRPQGRPLTRWND